MKTQAEFVDRWKCHLAGMALFGVASEVKDGPLLRAAKVLDIPARAEQLLRQMYDDLTAESPAGPHKANGSVNQQGRISR